MAGSLSLDLSAIPSRFSTCTQNNSCTTSHTPILVISTSFFYIDTYFVIDAITSIAISADGRFIVSGSRDRSIKIFDMHTREELHHFSGVHSGTLYVFCMHTHFLTDWIRSVALSADGKFIVSGSDDKSIKMFDVHTKQQLHHFSEAHSGTIHLSLCMHTHSILNRLDQVSDNIR